MADAEFTFKAEGADSVVAANKRIEKSMNAQAKASSKSGYAVLEASRALEDFSMAGMRGALNNIPQLLMNLGVGAGLTGVIGALTVVVWKGTEMLSAYLDKLQEMTEASANIGVPSFNEDDIAEAYGDEARKKVQEMTKALEAMNREREYLSNLQSNKREEFSSDQDLIHAREMLELTKSKASEDEKALATLRNKIRLQEEEIKKSAQSTFDSQDAVNGIKEQIKAQEKIISQKMDIDEINRKAQAEYAKLAKEYMQPNTVVRTRLTDTGFESYGESVPLSDKESIKAMERAAQDAKEWRNANLPSEEEAKESIQSATAAEEKLKSLLDQLPAAEHLAKMAKEEEESSKKITANKIEELKIAEEIASVERKQKQDEKDQKKREEEAKKLAAKMLQERAPDVSQFLSDQGRVGLAANEAKSAMDVLSIAKEQLKTLKEIARNTSKNRVLAYG